jgi:hypothetical protein
VERQGGANGGCGSRGSEEEDLQRVTPAPLKAGIDRRPARLAGLETGRTGARAVPTRIGTRQ